MKKKYVIGIEGYVGAGKTSICRELIKLDENAILLNGGNLYRTIVYALMKKQPNILKLRKEMKNIDVKKYMDDLKIEIKIEDRETKTYIDGIIVSEEELQSKASSLAVSLIGGIADNTKLFEYARKFIDDVKRNNNIVLSGRAIMQIYPNIDYHVFITASLKERVKRKCIQYNEIKKKIGVRINIILRDILQNLAGFYKIYPNTILVDVTECKDIKESTEKVIEYTLKK